MKKTISTVIIACSFAGMIACSSTKQNTNSGSGRSSSTDSTGTMQNNTDSSTRSNTPAMPDGAPH